MPKIYEYKQADYTYSPLGTASFVSLIYIPETSELMAVIFSLLRVASTSLCCVGGPNVQIIFCGFGCIRIF